MVSKNKTNLMHDLNKAPKGERLYGVRKARIIILLNAYLISFQKVSGKDISYVWLWKESSRWNGVL